MAWDSDLVTMVRSLIGDMSDTPTFTDERIQSAIAVAAMIVQSEFYYFKNIYTVDISLPSITPDPTEADTYDPVAIALFILKAACILNTNQYQGAVSSGIRVKDGDSEVDTTGGFKGYRDILELGPCGSYTKLLKSRLFLSGLNQGKAVMTPIGNGNSPPWGRGGYVGDFFDYLAFRG